MASGTSREEEKRSAARETIDILHEVSTLLVSIIATTAIEPRVLITNILEHRPGSTVPQLLCIADRKRRQS